MTTNTLPTIITDISALSKPCSKVSLDRGREIGEILQQRLIVGQDGIGLAANQIGVDARVCIIYVRDDIDPIVLINPIIIEQWDKIHYREACLSFPGKFVITNRYKYCIIQDDNHEHQLYFGPGLFNSQIGLLESICAQHEIAHLDGKTMYDFKVQPIVSMKQYSRNDIVNITDGIITKKIKFKKAVSLIEDGWVIVSNE